VSAPAAYLYTDADGAILRSDSVARRLLQLPAERRRSFVFSNLLRPDDRGALSALISRLSAEAEPAACGPI
jgi:hypothetical protein